MSSWAQPIRNRLRAFDANSEHDHGTAVSIKMRVLQGCFHRQHSAFAYAEIDAFLDRLPPAEREFTFEEHESGPEILVYLAVTTAGLTLAKSVVDLVATIIKARSEGIKRGDRADAQIELIIRRADDANGIREELVLRTKAGDAVDRANLDRIIADAAGRLLTDRTPSTPPLRPAEWRRRSHVGCANARSSSQAIGQPVVGGT